MQVKLYIDVPPYVGPGWNFFATANPLSGDIAEGWKRVEITVDLPCKIFDQQIEAEVTRSDDVKAVPPKKRISVGMAKEGGI